MFWEVPGHSPDSVAVQAGTLLHIGDIPNATSPGVAGLPGWNPEELKDTISRIRWIMNTRKISVVCPGHGRVLTPDQTFGILDRIEDDLRGMPSDLAIFDLQRIKICMIHALDLIEEAHRIFPVIAGRLILLRYRLEELGEKEASEQLETLFPDNEIDLLLTEFDSYYREFRKGRRREVQVVLKVIQILQKIQRSLPNRENGNIIDISLFRRGERLFSDFMGTIQGILPSGTIGSYDLEALLDRVISHRSSVGISDEDLLDSAEDEERFRVNLMNRMAACQKRSDLRVEIGAPGSEVMISADEERLFDLFSGMMDYYESNGADCCRISVSSGKEGVRVRIVPEGERWDQKISPSPALLREVGYAGGRILKLPAPGSEELVFMLKQPGC